MLAASAATIAAMTSGNCLKVECWDVTIVNGGQLYNGNTYRFSAADWPVTVTGGVGAGNTWQAGWIIERDQMQRKVGPEPQTMNLTISPQWDYPGGPPQIAGGPLLSQAARGILDGAIWTMYKGFFVPPTAGNQVDTSGGLVKWNVFLTEQLDIARSAVEIQLEELTGLLDVQMPRNIVQAGCLHRLYDAGCTLVDTDNTYTGTVTAVGANTINTGLTQADDFFTQGVVTFTSGALNGVPYTVKLYSHTGGVIKAVLPWPSQPVVGDTFKVTAGCDKKQATCSGGKFKRSGSSVSNILHFRGYPYTPAPETLYDGGTVSSTPAPIGSQGGGSPGSPFGNTTNPKKR